MLARFSTSMAIATLHLVWIRKLALTIQIQGENPYHLTRNKSQHGFGSNLREAITHVPYSLHNFSVSYLAKQNNL
ncbi:hypothetical protein [Providencia burhodogranariea]|uniref:hypothetical protein n=1 Tax=Providencia burhodogranariea TaxID=516074 RepID=UPI0002E36E84|nr:hypothetical protein [Providencia burhodogranariea]